MIFDEWCTDYDEDGNEVTIEGCVTPASGIVNFSNFGTYSLTLLAENGNPISVEIEDWTWDNDQTVLVLEYDGEADRYDLVEISETRLVFRGTYFDQYENEAGELVETQITETITCVRL